MQIKTSFDNKLIEWNKKNKEENTRYDLSNKDENNKVNDSASPKGATEKLIDDLGLKLSHQVWTLLQ